MARGSHAGTAALAAALALLIAAVVALAESASDPEEDALLEASPELAEKVTERLQDVEGLADVRASTEDGTITLRGTVARSEDRERAVGLAARVEGVDIVRNEISIDEPSWTSEGYGGP